MNEEKVAVAKILRRLVVIVQTITLLADYNLLLLVYSFRDYPIALMLAYFIITVVLSSK